jgi:hypothetical protein
MRIAKDLAVTPGVVSPTFADYAVDLARKPAFFARGNAVAANDRVSPGDFSRRCRR